MNKYFSLFILFTLLKIYIIIIVGDYVKKLNIFIYLLFVYLFVVNNVSAESFQCEYEFKEDGPTYIFEFDISNNSVKILNENEDKYSFSDIGRLLQIS